MVKKSTAGPLRLVILFRKPTLAPAAFFKADTVVAFGITISPYG
jgi:hypothetical protein